MHILEYENYEETKKHYDTDFSYNTYPCSIPLDFPCVPLHWHRETEIIYVKSGRGMVNVDGISYPVVKDSIVFILPGRLHSIAQYESEAFSYENIIFDMQMLIPKEGDFSPPAKFPRRFSGFNRPGSESAPRCSNLP